MPFSESILWLVLLDKSCLRHRRSVYQELVKIKKIAASCKKKRDSLKKRLLAAYKWPQSGYWEELNKLDAVVREFIIFLLRKYHTWSGKTWHYTYSILLRIFLILRSPFARIEVQISRSCLDAIWLIAGHKILSDRFAETAVRHGTRCI